MRRREVLGLLGATALAAPFVARAQTATTSPARVVLVANTTFEGDALMAAFGHTEIRNRALPLATELAWPRMRPEEPTDPIDKRPRCLINFRPTVQAIVEVWCIYDLLTRNDRPKSDKKAEALKT